MYNINNLIEILKNLKKAPKRKYSIKFVNDKKKLVEEIINQILKIESSDEIIKNIFVEVEFTI